VFGSGTDIGTNEYVVYKGSSTSVIVTSLTNGNSYYFTIFVRKGTEWSSGVEVIANPADVTIFIPGDMAIIAVNTNNATIGEEFTFVTFKDITVGTSIDFTDNGWQQENPDSWGTTEGTMRLTRISGGTLPAGTSVTVIMNSGNGDDQPDFDINVGGVDELGTNWSITLLNSSEGTGFNLNSDDEIWLMQGGSWLENDVTSGDPVNDDDEYTGYVLYGWTATGWGTGTSTTKSDLYPACECFNTNVSGISNQDKVKYIGPMTDVTKLDWIMRFNNVSNWTGYADDASYDAATPDYRGTGVTIGITNGGFESGRWTAGQNTDWFDCGNWQNLTIPDEETNVVISTTYASDDAVINNSENALCYDLTIESEIGLDFSDNTIEVHGSFINQSASITSANGTLLLASDDNVNVTSNGVSLYNVEVNGNGNFTLIDNLTLTGTFNLVNGFIETGANQIFVNNTAEAAITNYTAASYINGNLRRAITGAGSYDFPVGDASNFELATVDITSATSLSYLDAHFASADLGNINIVGLGLQVAGTSLVSVLDAGYWEIEPNTGASVDYDIEVNLAGASNVAADAEQHAVIKRDNASSDWELHGSHDNATQSIVAGVVTAKVSGLNAFSQFAIARSNQWVLAVELVDFSVKCETAGLSVNWTTVSEDNADYFMIEYSSDTRTWEMLQKLPAFGSTYITQEYQILLEDSPRKGYYRLAEVDMDGTVTHYAPAYVNCLDKDKQAMITVSPNPANNFVQLSAVKTTSNLYLVAIYDATGKLVNMLTWENPVEQELTLDLYGFAPGYYQLKIYNEREFYNKKLLVK
ncbi:MAG: T9SS type A sorting domain-containing protein, partial [Bacteroidota bacterium]|nr:T9SS type A sorting domain-containing protein [Bacteroidota bacterium]